jgi:multidrug efflux pump subunit AcrA (membrane-fusion protein)
MVRSFNFIPVTAGKYFAALLIASFLLACNSSRSADGAATPTVSRKIRPLLFLSLLQLPNHARSPLIYKATGTLVAAETSSVAPKVAGKVIDVGVNVGDFVSQGKMIVRLDQRDAKIQIVQAQAGVKQAEAAVRQAEARIGLSENGSICRIESPGS